jgi:BolA protein
LTDAKNGLSRAERIRTLLQTQLAPQTLEIVDESSKHAGHAGAQPGGETHYRVRIVAAAFDGQSRVARQRLVYDTLREEFDTGLHALSLDLKTPAEV